VEGDKETGARALQKKNGGIIWDKMFPLGMLERERLALEKKV